MLNIAWISESAEVCIDAKVSPSGFTVIIVERDISLRNKPELHSEKPSTSFKRSPISIPTYWYRLRCNWTAECLQQPTNFDDVSIHRPEKYKGPAIMLNAAQPGVISWQGFKIEQAKDGDVIHRQIIPNETQKTVNGGGCTVGIQYFRTTDGKPKWGSLGITANDITDRKLAEEKLLASQQRIAAKRRSQLMS